MPKVKKDDEVVEEGRVSICVPSKNALLLTRCRYDPLKTSNLISRFWDSSVQDEDDTNTQEDNICEVLVVVLESKNDILISRGNLRSKSSREYLE
ncbi:hypothetical protein LguiA_012813 [Lonicera macranthoides]